MQSDWRELIPFYQDCVDGSTPERERFLGMVEFIGILLTNRNLADIHFFTSHEILCVTLYRTYEEWQDKPIIAIDVPDRNRPLFKVVRGTRTIEEVSCPIHDGIRHFDEMVSKLRRIKSLT
jgi:hypothetical protein